MAKITGRETIFNAMVSKVADRMFETFRFEQGDPDTESLAYQVCQDDDELEYSSKNYSHETVMEFIDGYACERKNLRGADGFFTHVRVRPFAYKYYGKATDNAIRILAKQIIEQAKHETENKIHAYDRQKIAQDIRAEKEKEKESEVVKEKDENIGKRVCVDATFNPADGKTREETLGTIEDVDESGCFFQIRHDCDGHLGWHDPRTIKVLPRPSDIQKEDTWKHETKIDEVGRKLNAYKIELMPGITVGICEDGILPQYNINVTGKLGTCNYPKAPRTLEVAQQCALNIPPEWLEAHNFHVIISPIDWAKLKESK